MIQWHPFLTRWSRELMETELAKRVEPVPESSDWLGFAAAGANDIVQLEQRLGVLLPPSYKAFLLTSNGWRRTTPFIGRIRPTQEVDWFHVENEGWVEVYSESGSSLPDEEYFAYGKEGAPDYRAEHLRFLLQISDVDDGVYLLNPEAVTPDGEWEAWFFANWVPGAERYPSFVHLMIHEYRSFARLQGIQNVERGLSTLKTPAPNFPRKPAKL